MAGSSEPVVVFWKEWGIHFMVLVSFTVQVTLLLLADIRRRKDWAVLKVVIWSAYMLADTTAIYALGHMSVLCNWSPEHQLMALWAPLLLVHLGGQDNITAYAIEDNRLWLRHLQTFLLQVAAAVYVLYVSSVLSHPMSDTSKVRWAAMLMFVVGVVKYGERIWALKRSSTCASSSLSATSYEKKERDLVAGGHGSKIARGSNERNEDLIDAYSLLDVPKQMFDGPTSYVQISKDELDNEVHTAEYMLDVVKLQLSMMYDLLYTKASVVNTWYGLCSRVVVSLPFTIAALALLRSSSLPTYKRADVVITNVLLTGAVVLETTSVLRAIFSRWTAVLLYASSSKNYWNTLGDMVFRVEGFVTTVMMRALVPAGDHMRQHSLFKLAYHSNYSRGSKMATRVGAEDWWDSRVYSWSTEVPKLATTKVLELVSTGKDITKSQGLNAVQSCMNKENVAGLIWGWDKLTNNNKGEMNDNEYAAIWIWTEEELKLEERILVWHIATHVYILWLKCDTAPSEEGRVAEVLANYMFFLVAARPYMLPYPVSRQAYVKLCHDVVPHFPRDEQKLLDAVLKQTEALVNGIPLQLHPAADDSINAILDRGCQLAAKLIHMTTKDVPTKEERVNPTSAIDIFFGFSAPTKEPEAFSFSVNDHQVDEIDKLQCKVVVKMVLEVWVEMLCYTAYFCNENYHAKHLTDGGEFMTTIALLMIYVKNGFVRRNTTTARATAAGPSSSPGAATDDTDDIDDA